MAKELHCINSRSKVDTERGLSEDPGLTTYFFPGRDGVGGMVIARCVVVDGTPPMGEEVQC